jgi:stage IV sporulation protein FB
LRGNFNETPAEKPRTRNRGNPIVFAAEPAPTQFDLNFRVAGFPVRVHPLFWLIALLLGARDGDPMTLLIWAATVFLSILAHELGHAFAMRYYGQDCRIVMYMMGGLAIPESARWGGGSGRRTRGPLAQILISAAGPGAGFLLAGVVAALVFAAGGAVHLFLAYGFLPIPIVVLPEPANAYWSEFASSLLWVNMFWGLMNLLPVLPLDGGQIAREMLTASDPWEGVAKSLWLSVVVGAAIAVIGFGVLQDRFVGILFAMLAFSNFMALQNLRGRSW